MNTEELKSLGKSLLLFDQSKIEKLRTWLNHLDTTKKCPKGESKTLNSLKHLKGWVSDYDNYGFVSDNIIATFSWWDEDTITNIVDKFEMKDVTREIKIDGVTYRNDSTISEASFAKKVKDISESLKELPREHKRALTKGLTICIKKNSELNSWARYKQDKDEVQVKQSAKTDNRLYGNALYIINHELGHRWEHLFGLPEGYDDRSFYTTKYSYTEAFSASEAFAEAFAVSAWEDEFPQFKEISGKFKSTIKNKEISYNHDF